MRFLSAYSESEEAMNSAGDLLRSFSSSIVIASAVNIIDANGIPVGVYPLLPALIPTTPLNFSNDLGFSAHNLTHFTALNCTLDVYETEVEIDIETRVLNPSTLSLSDASTQRLLSPLMMEPDWKATDYLTRGVSVSQIYYNVIVTRL
jgi:hypothetical protein